ncbi:hypothetical protein KG089_03050 [Carnobacteriaceae bacterium zg-ZUI252]|nr:hypothetical protein [Carnobacteriaceae bacterium zg-ZUI252]MBS4769886.1 hypothetical protein [Carnobacteriaceae bacterium zg-ZUI240]
MDIMTIPQKETLIYFKKIDKWVSAVEYTEDGVILTFDKNTPNETILLFEKIKDKLDFKVKEYTISSI